MKKFRCFVEAPLEVSTILYYVQDCQDIGLKAADLQNIPENH